MSRSLSAVPQLVGWVFLPGSAATGAKAQNALGCVATKNASAGQWQVILDEPASFTDGTILIMYGPGVPTDTDSGVIASIGDSGATGNMIVTIRSIDAGAADNTQPLSLMFWKVPRLR